VTEESDDLLLNLRIIQPVQKHPSECFVLLYRLDLVTECGAVAHYVIIPNSGELSAQ